MPDRLHNEFVYHLAGFQLGRHRQRWTEVLGYCGWLPARWAQRLRRVAVFFWIGRKPSGRYEGEIIMKGLTGQLWFQVLIAMMLGLAAGLLLTSTGAGMLSEKAVEHSAPWIALPGNVFLALIKMVVIPLVLSSIVLGLTSSTDQDFLKKAALRIFPYFVGTTVIAIGIGIGLTLFIEPGRYINADVIKHLMEGSPTAQVHVESNVTHLADQIVALIPSSYIKLALERDMLATSCSH
jgi:proton glutamate symport protein